MGFYRGVIMLRRGRIKWPERHLHKGNPKIRSVTPSSGPGLSGFLCDFHADSTLLADAFLSFWGQMTTGHASWPSDVGVPETQTGPRQGCQWRSRCPPRMSPSIKVRVMAVMPTSLKLTRSSSGTNCPVLGCKPASRQVERNMTHTEAGGKFSDVQAKCRGQSRPGLSLDTQSRHLERASSMPLQKAASLEKRYFSRDRSAWSVCWLT